MKNIAVLLTCHNRKDKTINCLKSLHNAIDRTNSKFNFDIYLVDDGSSDGTYENVIKHFPKVIVIKGLGDLFWAGGMRLAWTNALAANIEYNSFLLLNDDTFLFRDALEKLLEQSTDYFKRKSCYAIFIGSTSDKETGIISYGGRKLYSRNRPAGFLIQSYKQCVECDLGEANIMLVDKAIVQKIGILSDRFTHGIADYDYTLRAKKEGFKVMVMPGILGNCTADHGKNWKSADTNLEERIKYLYSPKGLAYKEYLYYIRKHFPLHFPEAFFKLWLKTLFPIVYDKFKK